MKIHYSKDENGQEILTDESGFHQVMMEWEEPYMKKCIEILNPRGKVLEIGFGMGYSAQAIVDHEAVREYTVIECSPEVWKKVEEFKEKNSHKCDINLVKGRWQDVLYTCEKFDCGFFDDYCYENNTNRFEQFINEFTNNHMDIGGQVGAYSGFKSGYNLDGLVLQEHKFDSTIPQNCRYTNETWVQIFTKISKTSKIFKKVSQVSKNIFSQIIVQDNFEKNFEKVLKIFDKSFEVCDDGEFLFIHFSGKGAVVRIGGGIFIGDKIDRAVVCRYEGAEVTGEVTQLRVRPIR